MDYLNALSELKELCSPAIEPGLERIKALLDKLGQPQRGLRAIQVAGTNGKGSVTAMVDAMLLAEGFHTGRFISPHLHDYRERCLIDGQMLTEEQTAALLSRITAAIRALLQRGGPRPTEFEASTALSLLAMTAAQVEWAVLEVGLGGRFDATNVIDAPIAVITNIGRDHMEYLGDTIAAIAAEKAGIIKPGALVFTGAEGEALAVIARETEAQGASLCHIPQELRYRLLSHDESGQYVDITTPRAHYEGLRVALLGAHQGANAALAVDNDPLCTASVAEHRGLNCLTEQELPFMLGDILQDPSLQAACRAFAPDLLLSNIVAAVVAALAVPAAEILAPGGFWICGGILQEKELSVQEAFAAAGWQVLERREREGWLSFCLRHNEGKDG